MPEGVVWRLAGVDASGVLPPLLSSLPNLHGCAAGSPGERGPATKWQASGQQASGRWSAAAAVQLGAGV